MLLVLGYEYLKGVVSNKKTKVNKENKHQSCAGLCLDAARILASGTKQHRS